MSTNKIPTTEFFSDPVIGRGSGGKPAKLIVLGRLACGVVEVQAEGGTKTIGFPEEDAYTFDSALFERLRIAYVAQDDNTLEKLWESAVPASFPPV